MLRRLLVPAALLLVVLVTAACGSQPAAVSSTKPVLSAADKAEVKALEARPLKLPALLPDGTCRPDEANPTTGMYGRAPVFLRGGDHFSSAYGDYVDAGALTREGMVGPILVRGEDLKVANHLLVFVSRYVAAPLFVDGPQLGVDPQFGALYPELVIDTAYKSPAVVALDGGNYYGWGWRQGIAAGWSGCIGFQLDGPGFSFSFNGHDPTKD